MLRNTLNHIIMASSQHEPPAFVRSLLVPANDAGEAMWEDVASLHDNVALLPADQLLTSARRIASVVAIISTLYSFLVVFIRSARRMMVQDVSRKALPHVTEWKTAYQITNLLVNLGLGLLGIYHYNYTVTKPSDTPTAARVEGWEDMSTFAELQIAYQLWAIPVGVFLVNEHGAMLFHHVCVIVVGSMSAFFTNGFRYFTPFFYGLIEISSVPLAVMNAFKGNPELSQRYPLANQLIRFVFSVSFLTVRFFMWMPNIVRYLHVAAMLGFTCRSTKCTVGCALSWWSAIGLTCLQLLWSYKIVQGVWGGLAGGASKSREKKVV